MQSIHAWVPHYPAPEEIIPLTVSDYIPISLLNMSIKLVTKILVNRLQKVITSLIHKNQYGSSKGVPSKIV